MENPKPTSKSSKTKVRGNVAGPFHSGNGDIIIRYLHENHFLLYLLLAFAFFGVVSSIISLYFVTDYVLPPNSSNVTLPTIAPTIIVSSTFTETPTAFPSATNTNTPTLQPTETRTLTPTFTPTPHPTNTPPITPTIDPTLSPTITPTPQNQLETAIIGSWSLVESNGCSNLFGTVEVCEETTNFDFYRNGRGLKHVTIQVIGNEGAKVTYAFEFTFIEPTLLWIEFLDQGTRRGEAYEVKIIGNQLTLTNSSGLVLVYERKEENSK